MFIKSDAGSITENTFQLIGTQWMLITSGDMSSFNTMTASWGNLGIMWNKKVATIFVRPQRYTMEFLEKNEQFTLCFFDEKHKDILQFCGKYSGRDIDKVKKTGLLPVETEVGNVMFDQSKLVLECKKLYKGKLEEKNLLDPSLSKIFYPNADYHNFIIAEIQNCFSKKD